MAGPFDSAWLKWGRAVVHSQAYDAELDRARGHPHLDSFTAAIVADYNPKRHGFVLTIAEIDEFPPRLSLLLGDIVHDFRCALDHVAWTMYQRGSKAGQLTDRQERGIGFPIVDDPAVVDAGIVERIPGIRPTDLAKVRWCQPSRNAPRNRSMHCFTALQEFSNADKHRAIQPLFILPTYGRIQVVNAQHCEIPTLTRRGITKPFQVGTEIGIVRARKKGPEPKADVQMTFTAKPAIHPRITVESWLAKTRAFTADFLCRLAPAPRDALVASDVPAALIP